MSETRQPPASLLPNPYNLPSFIIGLNGSFV